MKLPPFSYVQPGTLAEAARVWSEREVMFMAGGQGLISEMAQGLRQPACVVDLSGLAELRGIRADPAGSVITIGAAVTLAELASHRELRGSLLAAAARHVAVPPVRTLATVGGNFCHGHPTSELPLAALVAEATVTGLARDGSPVRVTGGDLAALRPAADESGLLVTGLEWPVHGNGHAAGFTEVGEQRSWLPAVAIAWLADHTPGAAHPAPRARVGVALRDRSRFVISRAEGAPPCTAEEVGEAADAVGVRLGVPAGWLADLVTDQLRPEPERASR